MLAFRVFVGLGVVPPTSDDPKVAIAQQVQDFCFVVWGLQIKLNKGVLLGVLGRLEWLCCQHFQGFGPVGGAIRVLPEILM